MTSEVSTARIGWLVWGLGGVALAASLSLGISRRSFRDADQVSTAPASAAAVGEVHLDTADLPLAGIRTEMPALHAGGILFPASALLYLNGGTYVYLAVAPGRFVRERVTDLKPTTGGDIGWVAGWEPGRGLVVEGAQILLSQEFKPQNSGEGDDDDD